MLQFSAMLELSSNSLPEKKMLHIVFSNLDKNQLWRFQTPTYMNFAFSCNKSTCTPVTHQRQAHMNMQWTMHTHSKHKLTFASHLNPIPQFIWRICIHFVFLFSGRIAYNHNPQNTTISTILTWIEDCKQQQWVCKQGLYQVVFELQGPKVTG
jgi:hypothetical protein